MGSGQTRIAVIGCGGWGKNIARTMAKTGCLAAVVDPSEAGRKAAAEVAPGVPVHATPDAVLQDGTITGVMIATPAETHYALACRSIEAGKHTFVEKPLTIDLQEARDLVERARAAGRVLMVGHLLEYHPAILKLRELIEGGELGKVRYIISNRLNLGKIRTEENALWSFAPHDIAVILRLVGALPIQVVATGGTYVSPNIADVTITQLLFDSGVRSHVFVSWLHPFKEQKLVVVGSRKMATFDDIAKELVLHDQRVDWKEGQPVPVKGEGVKVAFDTTEPLMAECRAFIDAVATGRAPITDGQSGVRVLEVLHAAQQSLMTNGQPTPIARGVIEPRVVVRRGVELAGSVGDIGSRP
ncbi:MAG: Gfo/Idh/MocA family oxidoreductase [Planctomycetes bacterium]|nr:Gfo/Idh/MocA family oxidoreductase [Planctomycetota bacterium]